MNPIDKENFLSGCSKPQILFDPAFVEESVFLIMKSSGQDVEDFHRRRETLYRMSLDRDKAFRSFYEEIFQQKGWRQFFVRAAEEFPLLKDPRLAIFIQRVWDRRQEGSELYVDGEKKTAVMHLQALRILDQALLGIFLRHELMHISDMLDSGFGYSPSRELGGANEMEDHLIRDRFFVLWNIYVSSRLHRRGFVVDEFINKSRRDFQKVFDFLDDDSREKLWQGVFTECPLTQGRLLESARDQRMRRTIVEGGFLCPLCEFPCQNAVTDWSGDRIFTARNIQRDFPAWESRMGACQQCFDLYRADMQRISPVRR